MSILDILKLKLNADVHPRLHLNLINNLLKNIPISIPNKHQVILDCLLKTIQKINKTVKSTKTFKHAPKVKEAWKILNAFTESEAFQSLSNYDIDNNLKLETIKVIELYLSKNGLINAELYPLKCVRNILRAPCFISLLRDDKKLCINLMTTVVTVINFHKVPFEIMESILELFQPLSIHIFLRPRDESKKLRRQILFNLVNFICKFNELYKDKDEINRCECIMLNYFQNLLFQEEYKNNCCLLINNIFNTKPQEIDIHFSTKCIFRTLSDVCTKPPSYTKSVIFFCKIFQAFCQTHKNNHSDIFQFLVIITKIIGFNPCVGKEKIKGKDVFLYMLNTNILDTHLMNMKITFKEKPQHLSFIILYNFLELLQCYNISFETKIHTITLMTWLEKLFLSLFSDINNEIDIFIRIIIKFIDLNPLIVLPNAFQLVNFLIPIPYQLKNIPMQKYDGILNSEQQKEKFKSIAMAQKRIFLFTKCNEKLCEIHYKANRLPKLFAFILTVSEKTFSETNYIDIIDPIETDGQMLKSFYISFEKYIPVLPSSQLINILNTLIYHLETHFQKVLSNIPDIDKINIIHLELLSKFFYCFLRNLSISECTLPGKTLHRFEIHLNRIKVLLYHIGNDLINKKHNSRLMYTFLEISYTFMELSILLLNYSNENHLLVNTNEGFYNLGSKIKDILKNNSLYRHWNLINERVKNFGYDKCKDILYKLIIQRTRWLMLYDNNGTHLENIIETELSSSVLMGNSQTLITSLETPRLISLTSFIVEQLVDGKVDMLDWINLIESTHIQEYRPFIYAMVSSIIIKLKQIFANNNFKTEESMKQIVFKIIEKIDFQEIALLANNEDHSIDLQKTLDEMTNEINTDWLTEMRSFEYNRNIVKISPIATIFDLLNRLPLSFMPSELQLIIIITTIITQWNLEELNQHRPKELDVVLLKIFTSPRAQNLNTWPKILNIFKWCREFNFTLNKKLLLTRMYEILFKSEYFCNDITAVNEAFSFFNETNLQNPKIENEIEYIDIGIFISTLFKSLKHVKRIKLNEFQDNVYILCEKMNNFILSVPAFKIEPHYSIIAYLFLLKRDMNNMQNGGTINKIHWQNNIFYINLTFKQLSENTEEFDLYYSYIQLILGNLTIFQQYLPNNFLIDLWKVLSNDLNLIRGKELRKMILHFTSDIEFILIKDDIVELTTKLIPSNNETLLYKIFLLWESIISSNLNTNKIIKRRESLDILFSYVNHFHKNWLTKSEIIISLLNIFHSLLENKQIELNVKYLDAIFLTITSVPFHLLTPYDFGKINNQCSELIITIISYYNPLAIQRIPTLVYTIKYIQMSLVKESIKDQQDNSTQILMNCALSIKKISQTIQKYKIDLQRMVPECISNILDLYQTFVIPSYIKIHLNNSLYLLIDISENYALTFLKNNLPSSQKQLFNTFYDDYQKFYKFNAKI